MPTNSMHPSLSQLIPLSHIPNEFESISDALEDVFDDIFVKNLIYHISVRGEAGFYSFNLVTYNGPGIEFPIEEDLKLVLNRFNYRI